MTVAAPHAETGTVVTMTVTMDALEATGTVETAPPLAVAVAVVGTAADYALLVMIVDVVVALLHLDRLARTGETTRAIVIMAVIPARGAAVMIVECGEVERMTGAGKKMGRVMDTVTRRRKKRLK